MLQSMTQANEATVPWDVHVGRNLRAWRTARALTQADVASAVRSRGLEWVQSTVAALERGARTLAFHEAVALAGALELRPAELFSGHEWVAFGAAGKVRASAVANILSGHEDEVDPTFQFGSPDDELATSERMLATTSERSLWWEEAGWEDLLRARWAARGEAEMKATKSQGLDDLEPEEVAILAMKIFQGRSLTEERDRLLAEEADATASPRRVQAIRGHITRSLLEQIRQERRRVEEGEIPTGPGLLPVRVKGSNEVVLVHTDEKGQPTGEVTGTDAALAALDKAFPAKPIRRRTRKAD